MQKTSDINVVETRALPSPAALLAELPKTEAQAEFVTRTRREIHRLIFTDDRRFLLIIGPCSIHDLAAGRDYARRLAALAREVNDRVMIVMRVYFEKPRTTVGWKGLQQVHGHFAVFAITFVLHREQSPFVRAGHAHRHGNAHSRAIRAVYPRDRKSVV